MFEDFVEAVSLNLGFSVELLGVVGDALLKYLAQLNEYPPEILIHFWEESSIEQLYHLSLQSLGVDSLELLLCQLVFHLLLEDLDLVFD